MGEYFPAPAHKISHSTCEITFYKFISISKLLNKIWLYKDSVEVWFSKMNTENKVDKGIRMVTVRYYNKLMPGLYAEILQRGETVPYFKKRGGAQLQAMSGGTLEDNVVPHST